MHWAPGCRYVTRKNTSTNAVYVSRRYHAGMNQRNTFWCRQFHWIDSRLAGQWPEDLQCKVRHGPAIYKARLCWHEGGAAAEVVLDGNDQGLAPGQYAVFYRNGSCLGSAVICTASEVMGAAQPRDKGMTRVACTTSPVPAHTTLQ